MKPYSMDLRERVLADCDAGLPTGPGAAKDRVSPSWVRRLKQRRRETGEGAPRPAPPAPPPRFAAPARPGPRAGWGRAARRPPGGGPPGPRRDPGGTAGPARAGRRRVHAVARGRGAGPERDKKVLRAAEHDRADVRAQREQWRAA